MIPFENLIEQLGSDLLGIYQGSIGYYVTSIISLDLEHGAVFHSKTPYECCEALLKYLQNIDPRELKRLRDWENAYPFSRTT